MKKYLLLIGLSFCGISFAAPITCPVISTINVNNKWVAPLPWKLVYSSGHPSNETYFIGVNINNNPLHKAECFYSSFNAHKLSLLALSYTTSLWIKPAIQSANHWSPLNSSGWACQKASAMDPNYCRWSFEQSNNN